jgi:hypothetical protein
MFQNTQHGQSTKQSTSTGVVATELSTGGSAGPRKKFALTAKLEATLPPDTVKQTVSGSSVASEKSTRACAGGGRGVVLPRNSATVSKVDASPPPKTVISDADDYQEMIRNIMLDEKKKKTEKPVVIENSWTSASHAVFLQRTKVEVELLSSIVNESEEEKMRREAERAEKEAERAEKEAELAKKDAEKKAKLDKENEEARIAQQISLEAVDQWKLVSDVLKKRLDAAVAERQAPKFLIVQSSTIDPSSKLYADYQRMKTELSEVTAKIEQFTKLIEAHGECPLTFKELQANKAKAEAERLKEMKDSFHDKVDTAFKSNPTAPISMFNDTINSFMSAEDGGISVIFFDRFSHRKIGTFNNVCIDPEIFARIFLRMKDGSEISVFTVDQKKRIVSISEELMAHKRGTYKKNPKVSLEKYIFYTMREAVYYFLKSAKQVAFAQGIQLWELFKNVRRLDDDTVTERALEQRDEELRELWASVASSRQSASDAETIAPPHSNPFHVLADTVDCPPEAVTVDSPQEAAPVVPWTADDIQHACEVIRPMIKSRDSSLVSRVGGFASDPPAFKNPTLMGSPETFQKFMGAIPEEIRGDRNQALAFLQAAGLIAKEITKIRTKNGFKNVYLFLDVNRNPLQREDLVPRFVPPARAEFTAETATTVAVSADEFVPVPTDGSNTAAKD